MPSLQSIEMDRRDTRIVLRWRKGEAVFSWDSSRAPQVSSVWPASQVQGIFDQCQKVQQLLPDDFVWQQRCQPCQHPRINANIWSFRPGVPQDWLNATCCWPSTAVSPDLLHGRSPPAIRSVMLHPTGTQ